MRPEDQDQTPQPQQVAYRRRPQMVRFLVVGAVLGLLAGAALGYFGPATQRSSVGQDVVLLGAVGAIFGTLLSAIVYLVADWVSLRRTR